MSPKVQELIKKTFPLSEDDHIELPNGASLWDILNEGLPEAFEEYARFRVELCCGKGQQKEERTILSNEELELSINSAPSVEHLYSIERKQRIPDHLHRSFVTKLSELYRLQQELKENDNPS